MGHSTTQAIAQKIMNADMNFKNHGPLTVADLIPSPEFAAIRPQLLPRIMELREQRRTILGPYMSLVWENKALMWWQVQEMLRIEKNDIAQGEEEIQAYEALVPQPGALTVTWTLEFPDATQRQERLANLVGIENHLELGPREEGVEGIFVPFYPLFPEIVAVQGLLPKASSLYFMGIQGPGLLALAQTDAPPVVRCTHPAMQYQIPLCQGLWNQLRQDLVS